jgi:YD repeat-containing protein
MRVRGLIVLSVIALVVPAIAGTGANAADDCGIGTTGILSIDNAIAATPPCAKLDVSPQKAVVDSTFDFDASASTGGGGDPITQYEWDWGSGSFTEDSGVDSTVSHIFTTPGVYDVRVKVTSGTPENGFASQVATTSVVVWPDPNNPPVASVTTTSPAAAGVLHTFDASASHDDDPDGGITKYEWDWNNDGDFSDETTTTPTAQHAFSASGSTTVGVRVTDERPDQPMTDTDTVTFVVTQPPVAEMSATPNQVSPGDSVHFDGSGSSDPEGGAITLYEWDFDGNGSYDASGASPTIDHVYTLAGSYAARLRVTDPDGGTGTKSVAVVVANVLPVARLTISPNPVTAGQSVLLDGSTSSDADGSVVRYDWDLDGNGTFETTTNGTSSLATVYPNASTVSVGLRVRDDDGGTGITHVTLKVNAPSGGGTTGGGTTGDGTTGGGTTGGGTTGGGDTTGGGTTGGGTTGGGDTSGGSTTGGGAAGTPISASLGGSAVQKAKTVLKKGLALTCRADRASTCTVTATLSATDARRLKLASNKTTKPVVIGSARVTITKAGTKALTLKLSSKARSALKRSKKVRVTLTGVVTAGADRASVGRAVVVKG